MTREAKAGGFLPVPFEATLLTLAPTYIFVVLLSRPLPEVACLGLLFYVTIMLGFTLFSASEVSVNLTIARLLVLGLSIAPLVVLLTFVFGWTDWPLLRTN